MSRELVISIKKNEIKYRPKCQDVRPSIALDNGQANVWTNHGIDILKSKEYNKIDLDN